MLNKRQLLTIKHLKDIAGVSDPLEIISFCVEKINKPRYSKGLNRSNSRKRSKKYYQEIINYLAQQPSK